MPLWLKLSLRELNSDKNFTLSFVLNLCLGLVGFLTLDAFKASMEENISNRSRSILAADIGWNSKRPLEDHEKIIINNIIPNNALKREEIGLFSMASSSSHTRLAEIRAIDEQFPFYGTLKLKISGELRPGQSKDLLSSPKVWIYPELAQQLNVTIGDQIKIGELNFTVDDIITSDPSVSSIALSASPRVYLGLPYLKQTELLQFGSRVQYSELYKLSQESSVADLAHDLMQQLKSSDIRIKTHKNASRELGTLLSYLNDYLSLVAMVALFLAAVGTAYLFRTFMIKRSQSIAILLSLGYHYRYIQAVYISLLMCLGGLAAIVSIIITLVTLPTLPSILGNLMVDDIKIFMPFQSVLLAFLMGTGASFLFCFPFLIRLNKIKAVTLFREGASPKLEFRISTILAWTPALLVYWYLAVFQSNSWKMGSLFVGLFIFATVGLGLTGLILLKLFSILSKRQQNFILKHSLTNLSRQKVASLTCFIAIGLGTMLFNLIPQMKAIIEDQIKTPDASRAPSLFVFDIQDEQTQAFRELLKNHKHEVEYMSPVIRARLTDFADYKVELKNLEKQQQDSQEQRMKKRLLNRSYNLSYRKKFAESETLVGGRAFSAIYDFHSDQLPELSLEIRFAQRLGIEIGDTMTFDVQGVDIKGKVVSLRKVKWTSFHPNFFVQFQPGVLEDAPKTHIASISGLNNQQKIDLQSSLVEALPNVSIIDITQTIKRLLDLISQVTLVINFMAGLTALASIGVLFSISRHQAQTRQKDFNLFKVLGTSLTTISKMVSFEFGTIALCSSFIGLWISISFSYTLSYFIFDRVWLLSWIESICILLITLILACSTAYLATRESLQGKAIQLLK